MRILVSLCLVLSLFHLALSKESSLIDFELQDQFEQTYTQNSFAGKIVIVLGADREGSQYTDQWGPALGDSLKAHQIDSVQFVPLATLSGVPGLMKGMIKGFFPKDEKNWVLLDWDGIFASAYNFAPEKCNIVIFDKERNLIAHQPVTTFDAATAEALVDSIILK